MFIGHYAPAFIAAASPRAPRLGVLFVAAQLVDLAFFGFVLLGIEYMRETPGITATNAIDLYFMPFTHSLAGTFAIAAFWAAIALRRGATRLAAGIGAAVLASHWPLDLLVHHPDLTIAGVGPRYGFALWDRPAIEMPLELAISALAIVFYASSTRARDWHGDAALGSLAAALMIVQLVNWLTPQPATVIDPVPASLPLTALAAYAVLTALAWWTGRTRVHREGE